jgi:hypothetical protein
MPLFESLTINQQDIKHEILPFNFSTYNAENMRRNWYGDWILMAFLPRKFTRYTNNLLNLQILVEKHEVFLNTNAVTFYNFKETLYIFKFPSSNKLYLKLCSRM